MIERMLQRLSDWWFEPAPATRLAVLRVLIGGWVIYYIGKRVDLLADVCRGDPMMFEPVGLAHLLSKPLPPVVFDSSVTLLLILAILTVLGVAYRIVGPAFAILLLAVLSYRNSWSMIYHSDNALVLQALALGLGPAAAAWSLDARQAAKAGGAPPGPSWRFGWPIRLMCVATVLTYFLAGVAKVAGPLGWSWVTGESLRSQIGIDAVRKYAFGKEAPDLFYLVYDQLWLFTAIGILSLAFELAAPLFLARRWSGKVWAVGTWLMHWGIYFLMDIKFRYQLAGIMFAPFFKVEKPVEWVLRRMSRPTPEHDTSCDPD